MKIINKISLVHLSCLMTFWADDTLAQGHYNDAIALSEKFNRFEALQQSPDGQYLAVRKAYEQNRDTLMVFGSRSDKTIGCRVARGQYHFLGSGYLLLPPVNGKAELWNMETQKSIFFDNSLQIKVLHENGMFLIKYNQVNDNRLDLNDRSGKVLASIDNVVRYAELSAGKVAVICKNEADVLAHVCIMDSKGIIEVHSSTNNVQDVISGDKGSDLFVFELTPDGRQLVYYLSDRNEYLLNDILQVNFDSAYIEKTLANGIYFLRLWEKSEKDNGIVDIWYTNDRDLESKYYPKGIERYYFWEPSKNSLREIAGNKDYVVVNTGSTESVLAFDPLLFKDYTASLPDIELNVCNQGNCIPIDTLGPEIYVSGKGKYVLAPKDGLWSLYDLTNGEKVNFGNPKLKTPFFSEDESTIYFGGEGGLWSYKITTSLLSKLMTKQGSTISIVNGQRVWLTGYNIYQSTISKQYGLLLKTSDNDSNSTSLLKYHKNKFTELVAPTENLINDFQYDLRLEKISYLEQNFNLPPKITHVDNNKRKSSYENDWEDNSVNSLRRKIVKYPDSKGEVIEGTLFYPARFDPHKTYPMVVYIYQVQSQRKNTYLTLSFNDMEGFNARALIENGYFVFFPDITRGDSGPGFAALQCINNALDAVSSIPGMDKKKIGLIGHSFGGYEVNFIATRSNRFSAFVSGCGNVDIVNNYHTFNKNFLSPSYWRFEGDQFYMDRSFSENKEMFYKNNPLYEVDKVTTPILLWTGLEDENVKWEESRTFYNALRRNGKKAIALFYTGEGHALLNSLANRDLSIRIMEWFDYYLKEKQEVAWIAKEM